MWKNFLNKLKESFFSVFPITLVIIALIIFLVPVTKEDIIKLLISSVFLTFGMSLFSLGADNSMIELGQNIGSTLSKTKKPWLMIVLGFIIGFVITFAEPDLMVLAEKVAVSSSLSSKWIFIAMVSLGVGIFLIFAILKLLFKWRLSTILTISYSIVLVLAFVVNETSPTFMSIAFDSGSVTTGPISVPFLLAFGLGLSAVRSGNNEDDSFGLIALSSAGPILAVMIMSLFLTGGAGSTETSVDPSIFGSLLNAFLTYLKDVAFVILPIVAIFTIFQIVSFKFPFERVVKMLFGFLLTYVGIVLFLTGVECGYMHLGSLIGEYIGELDCRWIAIPIGFVLGIFAILAEPALHVLKKQVEDITGGVIKQKVILIVISLGVAFSVTAAVIQNLFNFSLLYIVVPVYLICIILAWFNSKLFTAVAFDSGGVATGAMAVSFTLPFVMGLSTSASNGFGTVALIAVFPILTMQILGAIFKIVVIRSERKLEHREESSIEIIEFEDFEDYLELQEFEKKSVGLNGMTKSKEELYKFNSGKSL